jgi:hypothetical protein
MIRPTCATSPLSDYVKSHTLLSDGKHSQGVVLSEIVKANIPVKNGVVHLIQKPLMVVDNNVRQLLEVSRTFEMDKSEKNYESCNSRSFSAFTNYFFRCKFS